MLRCQLHHLIRHSLFRLALATAACGLVAPAAAESPATTESRDETQDETAEFDELRLAQNQPPAVRPAPPRRRPPPSTGAAPPPVEPQLAALVSAPPRFRLASIPDMFGDAFLRGGTITVSPIGAPFTASADTPLAGATRGVKVGENNKAVPMDRVYVAYSHFHNALRSGAAPGTADPALSGTSIDRYTVGIENSFDCRQWSLELRMPFTNGFRFDTAGPPAAAVDGGEVGNLSVILKYLLYEQETTSIVAGLGIETPTGSNARATVGGTTVTVENDAVFLLPYVGCLGQPSESLFFHGFAQLALAANGNDVVEPGAGRLGVYTDQNLLYLDGSAGYWLQRCPDAPLLTGLAAILELHYTTTLQDTDAIGPVVVGGPTFSIRNAANRVDVLNATVGLYTELCRDTTLHVAGVFPLRSWDNRFFDAELLVQVNRRF